MAEIAFKEARALAFHFIGGNGSKQPELVDLWLQLVNEQLSSALVRLSKLAFVAHPTVVYQLVGFLALAQADNLLTELPRALHVVSILEVALGVLDRFQVDLGALVDLVPQGPVASLLPAKPVVEPRPVELEI